MIIRFTERINAFALGYSLKWFEVGPLYSLSDDEAKGLIKNHQAKEVKGINNG